MTSLTLTIFVNIAFFLESITKSLIKELVGFDWNYGDKHGISDYC